MVNPVMDMTRSTAKPSPRYFTRGVAFLRTHIADAPKTRMWTGEVPKMNGHTDSTGAVEYNMTLSDRRADSVADYLAAQGVMRNRVFTQGFGPHYPIADNSTAEGRQLNRRVELVLKPLTQG